MTAPELNEGVARAMGWRNIEPDMMDFFYEGTMLDPNGVATKCPDFLTDPRAFVDLLLWHAREGRNIALDSFGIDPCPDFPDELGRWRAQVQSGTDDNPDFHMGVADAPARALALATVAWKEGAK